MSSARLLSPETEDRRGVSVRVLRFVMTATERLSVLVVEVRTSSTSTDDLVDVERTAAGTSGDSSHHASAITLDDSDAEIGALSLLGASLLRARSEWSPTDRRRAASQSGTAANHPFLFGFAARSEPLGRRRRIRLVTERDPTFRSPGKL
jgi:hypothetical protein